MQKTFVVMPAAGSGTRMGSAIPKQFLRVAGKPILVHTLNLFLRLPFVSGIFLVVAESSIPDTREIISECVGKGDSNLPGISIFAGGEERRDSVYNALRRLPEDCEWVIIHDGVRPFATPRLIEATLEGARGTGACIAALPSTDTVKQANDGLVKHTLQRDEIWLVQTPQVFRKAVVMDAYEQAVAAGCSGTDDSFFVERMGIPVSVVPGERSNIKLTTPEDLQWAEWYLGRSGQKR